MQISIWQQFSSNHSASFTVVGVFKTAKDAKEAAGKLNGLLKSIWEWYEQPENAEVKGQWLESGDAPPSPPEQNISKQFDIEWSEFSLDWVWLFDEQGNGPVSSVENIVFVNGQQSWLGSKPADALVTKLGGKALVDGTITFEESESTVLLTLTCAAPDEATASSIKDAVENYLKGRREASERFYENPNGMSVMFDTPWKDYVSRPFLFGNYSTFSGTVHQEQRRLTFQGCTFFYIDAGFPAMLAYLKDKGCTDIEYTFTEEREEYD